MQAPSAGRGVRLGPQRVLDDLAVDRGTRVDREQPQQAPDARLGPVEQDAASVDVEREATEGADADGGLGRVPGAVRAVRAVRAVLWRRSAPRRTRTRIRPP